MVLTEVGASAGAALHELFSYNRENFMFDREMRQKNEFQILAFRNKQAELWREDVRDIIGMTEKKMDTYLIVATLQLGMCVGLFAEGRLEPGTPPWLLTFYMLSLGGAFMYLLMAAWFAMHAAVVANCSSTRLLTQFVRLPIPTWEHLEDLRTYGSSFESVRWRDMLRIPFFGDRAHVKKQDDAHSKDGIGETAAGFAKSTASTHSDSDHSRQSACADPWGLERDGKHRKLYELQPSDPALRAHIGLARRASVQYQCFDAFTRVSMTFGTNQLLNAISYYCLGYVAWQDGAVWPAVCVVSIMVCMMLTLVNVDIQLSSKQRVQACALIISGPICSASATIFQVYHKKRAAFGLVYCLPVASISHALWLLWALVSIGVEKQPNGSVLPTRFRAVLYLDVFGWLSNRGPEETHVAQSRGKSFSASMVGVPTAAVAGQSNLAACAPQASASYQELWRIQQEVRADVARWRSERLHRAMHKGNDSPSTSAFGHGKVCPGPSLDPSSTRESRRVPMFNCEPSSEGMRSSGASSALSPEKSSSMPQDKRTKSKGLEAESADTSAAEPKPAAELDEFPLCGLNLLLEEEPNEECWEHHDGLGIESSENPEPVSHNGPKVTHTVRTAPKDIFDPHSFVPTGFPGEQGSVGTLPEGEDVVTGQGRIHTGRVPARVFHGATFLLVALWTTGALYPCFQEFMTVPKLSEILAQVEEEVGDDRSWHQAKRPGVMGTDPNGLPMFIPERAKREPDLPQGELISTEWPSHAGFFPRVLSVDRSGQRIVVADDIGLYTADFNTAAPADLAFNMTRALQSSDSPAEAGVAAKFMPVSPCASLEGQALRDISLVCPQSTEMPCRVLVLIEQGPRLTECPLHSETSENAREIDSGEQQNESTGPQVPDQEGSWTILTQWLKKRNKEQVASFAVDETCIAQDKDADNCTFDAKDVGCVVIGTSAESGNGRIVQLRGVFGGERSLVPERSIRLNHPGSVLPGAIHVMPTGYIVVLSAQVLTKDNHYKTVARVEAFRKTTGAFIGVWRLPMGVDWLTMSGGGADFFVLGVRDKRSLELHRFPVPPELLH